MRNINEIDINHLKDIIRETITEMLHTSGKLQNDKNINAGSLIKIFNIEDFKKWSSEVWDMLVLSYEDIGGLKSYRNYADFCKKHHIMEIVVDGSGRLLSCATFRRIEGSFKMVAIGCNQEEDGKLALQQIIQNAILNADLHYWAEVSGKIEHYFKKHNGFPMPNALASEILGVDSSQITLSKTDNVHYDRPIGVEGEIFTKMIFGIKSEDIYYKALQEVENYGSFMREVNSIKESIGDLTPRQAIYIIENIYRAHEEDGFNELIPSWHEALTKSVDVLKRIEHKTQTIEDYIDYGEYLLSDMQVLVLHTLKI